MKQKGSPPVLIFEIIDSDSMGQSVLGA